MFTAMNRWYSHDGLKRSNTFICFLPSDDTPTTHTKDMKQDVIQSGGTKLK